MEQDLSCENSWSAARIHARECNSRSIARIYAILQPV